MLHSCSNFLHDSILVTLHHYREAAPQRATVLPSILSDSVVVQFDVGYNVQGQLLKWDAHCWHGWAMVGTSLPGCGYGPAALSLVLGCSHRQGHMPEGELATLLPIPPGALLNPSLLFLPSFLFSFLPLLFTTQTHPFTPIFLFLSLTSYFPSCLSLSQSPLSLFSLFDLDEFFLFLTISPQSLTRHPTFSLPPPSLHTLFACRSR